MLSVRIILQTLLFPFLLTGCLLSPSYLVNGPELARSLPNSVKMDDYVEKDWTGRKVTVGMKLARLGAYCGQDGKLYDRSGRRIEFFRHYEYGGAQHPNEDEILRESLRRLEELKKTCTVIEISRDPDLPPPV
jgi:hypothetical protein